MCKFIHWIIKSKIAVETSENYKWNLIKCRWDCSASNWSGSEGLWTVGHQTKCTKSVKHKINEIVHSKYKTHKIVYWNARGNTENEPQNAEN